MSSYGNRTPEPVSLYTISGKGRGPAGFSTTKHRQGNFTTLDETKQGHSRVFSETSVPSSLQTAQQNVKTAQSSDGESAGQDRHSEPSRNWFWNGLTRNTSLNHANRHPNGLQALNEDGPALDSFDQPTARQDTIQEEQSVDLHSPDVDTFNTKHPPVNGLTRARSAAQMHDLREQMQGLKGKISTLKQRAREDSLRRRSLQSLRTSSPFTDAEQWYAETPESDEAGNASILEPSQLNDSTYIKSNRENDSPQDSGHASPMFKANGHEDPKEALPDGDVLEGRDFADEQDIDGELSIKSPNGFPSPKKRLMLIDDPPGLPDEDDIDILKAEETQILVDHGAKDDSLYGDQDYHEASASPFIERHEDRPDAFDYEHFILHSAMGSYSGVGVRRSSSKKKRANSQSSESSVETTKPRNSMGGSSQGEERLSFGAHARQGSVDTVSSVNTFATADEGEALDIDTSDSHLQESGTRSWHPGIATMQRTHERSKSAGGIGQANGYGPTPIPKAHITTAQRAYIKGTAYKALPPSTGPPPPPPDLLTVLSATTSWQEGAPPRKISLGDRDRELVERLVRSLAKVCSQVHTTDSEESKYEARVVRRKLDAARRVLDGEMNGEAF